MALLLALAVAWAAPTGCSDEPATFNEGHYIGNLVSFRLEAGTVQDFRFTGIDCSIPHPEYPVVSLCVNRPQALPLETANMSASGSFDGTMGDLEIQGKITSGEDMATGTWRYESTCFVPETSPCVTEGTWEAQWHEITVNAPDPDAGNHDDTGLSLDVIVAPPPVGTPDPGDPGPVEIPATAADHQKDAADIFAEIRGLIGHFAVTQDSGINAAAQGHADYYGLHQSSFASEGLSAHQQNPDWEEGFIGVNVGDRLTYFGVTLGGGWSEIMAFSGSVKGSFNGWMETLYHRIPLVHPNTAVWGYGMSTTGAAAEVLDSIFGAAASSEPARWPVPWATNVYRSWGGAETPQPPLPDGEIYPSGPIVTITFANGTAPEVFLSAELTGEDGAAVPIQIQTPQNDSWLKSTWALYPYDPLLFVTTYTVTFVGKKDGKDFVETWSFTTE
jgi:hypothetical protein